jgi:6-pyruvoyltetrahydropterin/6-carboxytetrahydropterin synthase
MQEVLEEEFSIKVYKQYFNFAAAHFMVFKDGSREPLHGHNYRVALRGKARSLDDDMVFDFLNIKPIVREVCDSLDHRLLIPGENNLLKYEIKDQNISLETPDGSCFSVPADDVKVLPILNTSVERIAVYLAKEINERLKERFKFSFKELEIEVEETVGQSATYCLKNLD